MSAQQPVVESGSPEVIEALAHLEAALADDDYDTVVEILLSKALMIGSSHLARLEAALDALPQHVLESQTQLVVMKHGISTFFDQDHARHGLDMANQLLSMRPEDSVLADEVVAGIGAIFALRATGGFADCVPIVDQGRARAEADRESWLEIPGQLRSLVLLQWGICRMLVADLRGAMSDFQESYWAGRRAVFPHFARNGAENTALLMALVDSFDDAQEWLAKARTIEPAPAAMRHFVEELDPLVEALLSLGRLDPEGARKALGSFTPAPETRLSWSFEAYTWSRLAMIEGEPLVGLDTLDRVSHPRGSAVVPGSIDERLLAAAEAELAMGAGRAARTARVLDRVGPSTLTAPARARHALLTGDAAGALASAVAGLQDASTFGRVDLAAIAAVSLLHLGRSAEAAVQFSQAVELARSRGALAPFVLLPRRDVEALCALVPAAVEVLAPALAWPTSVERVDVVRLSTRERRVLVELARTGAVQEIADALFVSVNTVKSQLRSIYRKLDVNSREGALAEALRLGFDLEVSG